MAAKTTGSGQYAEGLMKLVFNATNYATIADNASSSPTTTLYVSLHTASPTATGSQTSSEAAYGSYARQPVVRSSSGWTVSANVVYPVANITFPAATSGTETETFFGIGTAVSGTGNLLYFGSISPTIAVSTGVTPILVGGSGQSTVTET